MFDTKTKIGNIIEQFCSGQEGKDTMMPLSEEVKRMLMEVEPECREKEIYKRSGKTLEEMPKFMQDMDSQELFKHMLMKIVEAPFDIYAMSVPILMIPNICDRIREEEQIKEWRP